MTINEHRRSSRAGTAPLGHDDGVAGRRVHRRCEPCSSALARHPLGRTFYIGLMLRARAHARNAQEIEQLGAKALEVLLDVAVYIGHQRVSVSSLSRASAL